jgi:hypothetical protein
VAEEVPKKGRKFDFKIIAPEVTTSIRPGEESNHESNIKD